VFINSYPHTTPQWRMLSLQKSIESLLTLLVHTQLVSRCLRSCGLRVYQLLLPLPHLRAKLFLQQSIPFSLIRRSYLLNWFHVSSGPEDHAFINFHSPHSSSVRIFCLYQCIASLLIPRPPILQRSVSIPKAYLITAASFSSCCISPTYTAVLSPSSFPRHSFLASFSLLLFKIFTHI
jgi:hypothetical protein